MCEFHEAEKLYKNILREHPNYVDCKGGIFDVLMMVNIIFYLQHTLAGKYQSTTKVLKTLKLKFKTDIRLKYLIRIKIRVSNQRSFRIRVFRTGLIRPCRISQVAICKFIATSTHPRELRAVLQF